MEGEREEGREDGGGEGEERRCGGSSPQLSRTSFAFRTRKLFREMQEEEGKSKKRRLEEGIST